MADLIDRDETIKRIDHQRVVDKSVVKRLLYTMPTVHQQRTCVNCGRTVNNGGWYPDGRTRCPIEEHYSLPKDGYCHLWEKRNVTDDHYCGYAERKEMTE